MNANAIPYKGAEPYIFISYSHKDRERVFSALDAMRGRGYRIWYDANIEAGTQWTDALAASIAKCAVFMPFVSASYGDSEYCMQEIRYAKSKKATISPVFLTDTSALSDNLRYQLEHLHGFSLKSASPGDFVAWMDKQTIFRPCRAAADTGPGYAELVTNEQPMTPSRSFVGRVDIMRDIEAAFRDGETVVNLYGMGGIGKSEICRKLFHDRADALSRYVGWLTWRGALQNTLYAQFRDIRENNAERYLQLAREYVGGKGRNLLLFLDNADDMTNAQASKLTSLGCRFLVTSRQQQEHFRAFRVRTLTPEECRILYRRALYRNETLTGDSPDAALDEIIRLAACHTLTVELLAKTQREAGIKPEELLDKLRQSGFDLTGVEEEIVYEHRPEEGGDGDGYRTFLEHMTVIFDLSQLRDARKGAEALRALQGMSLLSPNTPIPVETVKAWLDLPNLNGLNRASDAGWLDKEMTPDGTWQASIHPVVAAVVRHTEPPDADYTDAVAERLFHDMIPGATEVFTTKLPLLTHAEALYRATRSMDLQTENYADMLHQIGYLTKQQGNYASALEWYQKALPIVESVLGKDHPSTATTYNNIAGVYNAQGDYASALEWYQKALRIRESVLGKDHPSTATTYNNIALVYKAQGDYAGALEWFQKALPILENVLGANHPNTAGAYNNIAGVYDAQGDYASALEWYQKALRIRESVLGKDHPSTATTYHNIGTNYFEQGDFREALQWLEKARVIELKVLGTEHPLTKNTQRWIDDAQRALSGEE